MFVEIGLEKHHAEEQGNAHDVGNKLCLNATDATGSDFGSCGRANDHHKRDKAIDNLDLRR